MIKKLVDLFRQNKEYLRVDLVMYGALILLIIFYLIYSAIF